MNNPSIPAVPATPEEKAIYSAVRESHAGSDRVEYDDLLDPEKTRLGGALDNPPPPPRFLVARHLPLSVGADTGTGFISKTTRHQWEHIHIVLGLPLYGREVLAPCPVLTATKEDSQDDFFYRYHMIARDMGLSAAQRQLLKENLFVADLSGTSVRLAFADQGGNLARTALADAIIEKYRGLSIGLVDIDPLNLFGPGERFVNDGEAIMMEIGRRIARGLSACCRYTSHVSKDAARNRIVDMHAGRGGAAGADNARFVHVSVIHDLADEKDFPRPLEITDADVVAGNVIRLHMPKVTGVRRIIDPIWIVREGYSFRHIEAAPATGDEREAAHITRLREFLAEELKRGIKHTNRTLEDARSRIGGISRDKLRDVLNVAQQKGHVILAPLPEAECQGAKTHYWLPVGTRDTPAR